MHNETNKTIVTICIQRMIKLFILRRKNCHFQCKKKTREKYAIRTQNAWQTNNFRSIVQYVFFKFYQLLIHKRNFCFPSAQTFQIQINTSNNLVWITVQMNQNKNNKQMHTRYTLNLNQFHGNNKNRSRKKSYHR